ncbi:MAG TPA: fumarylacetoacetate hydrolase family protein [Acidimicrobiales bacterium]|jgi:2-keto-4-pentenoate hydratase/2-oxohepta-3-ene-1,7-dioic acid hydratase in catechol pathway
MRLVSFVRDDDPHRAPCTGLVEGDEVVDLTDPVVGLPADMADLLAAGPGAMDQAAAAPSSKAARHPWGSVTLLAPVPRPAKVMGLGMNYGAHVAEMGRPRPENQVWFNKQRTCVIAPSVAIEIPRASPQVDYEGELAFIIGRRCRHVPAAEAPSVVAGFTIMNDVSVRDWQWRTPTWTMGKSFDTHGPLGPWLVTPDEIADPHRLRLRTWVNGELRQDSSTDDMIFSCWQMVEELTTVFTLEPGDVVSTGTPAGVGASFDPPKWLVAGDTVRIDLEGVGVLENPVIDEVAPPHP